MNQIKTLLRDILKTLRDVLGELRMIHAELNALRVYMEEFARPVVTYTYTVPDGEEKPRYWYDTTYTGDTQTDDS